MPTPTNNELKIMIDNLERNVTKKLDEHAEVHSDIFQLLKDIQKDLKESNGWKNKFMGAISVIIFIVFPLMSWALYQIVHIDERIERTLSDYEFDITP